MLNEKICKLREELNQSILTNQDYSITYQLSVELDELIAMVLPWKHSNKQKPRNQSKIVIKCIDW